MNLKNIFLEHKKSTIYDLFYDISKTQWILWKHISSDDFGGDISSELDNNNIEPREIIRLNPFAIDFVAQKIQ